MSALPIGRVLRAERERQGLSRNDLVLLLDGPERDDLWLGTIERGVVLIRLDDLVIVGNALRVSAWRLVRRAERLAAAELADRRRAIAVGLHRLPSAVPAAEMLDAQVKL